MVVYAKGIFPLIFALQSSNASRIYKAKGDEDDIKPRQTQSSGSGKIVGGTYAAAGTYPWFTMLTVNDEPYCGGSLVSSEWVLTAAHCMTDEFRNNGAVRVGAFAKPYTVGNNGGQDVELFNLQSIVENPSYNSNTENNDFALLRLDGTSSISPVSIDSSNLSDTYSNGKWFILTLFVELMSFSNKLSSTWQC